MTAASLKTIESAFDPTDQKQYLVLYRLKNEVRGKGSYDVRRDNLISRMKALDGEKHISTSAWVIRSGREPHKIAEFALGDAIDPKVDFLAVVESPTKWHPFGVDLDLQDGA